MEVAQTSLGSLNFFNSPMCFYLYHRTRGDLDQAFIWLERAIEEHDSFVASFRVLPIAQMAIPDEPRFNELLKKMGFVRMGK